MNFEASLRGFYENGRFSEEVFRPFHAGFGTKFEGSFCLLISFLMEGIFYMDGRHVHGNYMRERERVKATRKSREFFGRDEVSDSN